MSPQDVSIGSIILLLIFLEMIGVPPLTCTFFDYYCVCLLSSIKFLDNICWVNILSKNLIDCFAALSILTTTEPKFKANNQ